MRLSRGSASLAALASSGQGWEGPLVMSKDRRTFKLLEGRFHHLSTTNDELINYFKPEDADRKYNSSEDYRDKVNRCKYKTTKCLKARRLDDSSHNFNSQSQSTYFSYKERINLRLPKLCIRKFSGDICGWLSFWNSFETDIHKNDSLDDVDKFNYLKTH
ncbi:DUF1758 domain-containing protein [Trichonephila inaurata madagascariensis]|uniref:DUF1758 domain-containing protein n=1 Tax=Trichonephila inaurata madagascariensis TaxID=2747483 RepID=A0A8X7BU83_9ARAC|nr:DUF1758 domain-containing protein [Trichonephila inaurata madagascariensis]